MSQLIASGITLEAIGITLVGGLCITTLTVLAFGIAVMVRHTNVAPRCATRHPNTIWRSQKDLYGNKSSGGGRGDVTNSGGGSIVNDKFHKKEKKKRGQSHQHQPHPSHVGGASASAASGDGEGIEIRQFQGQGGTTATTNNSSNLLNIITEEKKDCGDQFNINGTQTHAHGAHHQHQETSFENDTLYNEPPPPTNTTSTSTSTNTSSKLYAHPQDRGNPFLGWIPWTLHLSYDRMLRGIPGTGTREKGLGGKLLGVNLDAIILFRYHALCLRITAVVCFICIGIILPLNLTACNDVFCNGLTNYGRTTIANIESNKSSSDESSSTTSSSSNIFSSISWTGTMSGQSTGSHWILRLYAIAFCTWYITYFALKNLKRDWRENLVLRRVYYLEADHYGNRQSELDRTVFSQQHQQHQGAGEETNADQLCEQKNENKRTVDKRSMTKDREPWLPHSEYPETVPNIELYSVLVGGMPSVPDEVVNSKDMSKAIGFSKQASIDWQLAVATTFFDHCVPNQPGFSSSVVAVTILPGAPALAKAWRKWYAAAGALRRLRFIREVINDKRSYTIEDTIDRVDEGDLDEEYVLDEECGVVSQTSVSNPHQSSAERQTMEEIYTHSIPIANGTANTTTADQRTKKVTFDHKSAAQPTQAESLTDVDYRIFESLDYGPEQQAMYAREMSQAAACCPKGCCEGRVRRQPIDKLLDMEKATIDRLKNAQYELQCAQMQAAVSIVDGADKGMAPMPEETNSSSPPLPSTNQSEDFDGLALPSINTEAPQAMSQFNGHFQYSNTEGDGDVQSPSRNPPSTKNSTNSILRMTSEGKFLFYDEDEAHDDEDAEPYAVNSVAPSEPSLRRRANTSQSALSGGEESKSSNQWNQVNSILRTNDAGDTPVVETGVWQKPSVKSFMSSVKSDVVSGLRRVGKWTKGKTKNVTSKLAKDSTYAVVTFSSRQAAVAARHCLADGRGVERWLSLETIPVPPLADAAPCDIITCRGCCRPVTLNLNRNQLMLRRYLCLASLAFFYVFYTIPITAAQSLVAPENLQRTLPGLHEWLSNSKYFSAEIMSGLVAALLYTSFFALCPIIFKAIANSGSQATSVDEAERYALKYYWYFMLVTAFVFTGLADAAISIWDNSNLDETFEELIENIASQTPLKTAATWLNWIIVRTTMTLPLQYLLGVNSFAFEFIGWKCCARCVLGGGPGGPIPYRIYIDGGVVFLCVVALAPQSPLVAPFALLYYLVCIPLWRRNCIFMYRPRFDSGGSRWPFISDMLIASLFMGQILLTLQMVLRDAYGPALISAFPAIPTYLYRNYMIKRFKPAFEDAGLLQTSLLDGWDNTVPTSVDKREEFRKFLINAHKAAYIPVCIAGGATNILTAEPAVVVPSENDDMLGLMGSSVSYSGDEMHSPGQMTPTSSSQRGACVRRTVSSSSHTPRNSTSPMAWQGMAPKVSKRTHMLEGLAPEDWAEFNIAL